MFLCKFFSIASSWRIISWHHRWRLCRYVWEIEGAEARLFYMVYDVTYAKLSQAECPQFRDLCIIFRFSTNNNWNSYFANRKNISPSYLLVAICVSRDCKSKINYLGILKLYNNITFLRLFIFLAIHISYYVSSFYWKFLLHNLSKLHKRLIFL